MQKRALGLIDVVLSVVMLVSVLASMLSLFYSVEKRKLMFFTNFSLLVQMMNCVQMEYSKLRFSGSGPAFVGNYKKIGAVSLPSNLVIYRGRADLDGDGMVNECDPIWIFLSFKNGS